MTPDELLKRLEGAAGPDRELDCLLWQMFYPDERIMFDAGKAFGPGPKYPATYGLLKDFPLDGGWTDWVGVARHIGAAEVTSSIDAALGLVERVLPGRSVDLLREAISWLSKRFAWHTAPKTPEQIALLPLAILIALIKATRQTGVNARYDE